MKMGPNHLPERNEAIYPAWYALYTKHQHEKKAADFLDKNNFEVLNPLHRTVNQWKDRKKEVLLPVFPCYLFVRTTLTRKLEVLRTPGVFWMVSSGGQACAVPEDEMEMIRRISAAPDCVHRHEYPAKGEYVRVRMGPFAGLRGVLTRVKNSIRVVMSVELLQKAVALELDGSQIEACDPCGESSLPSALRTNLPTNLPTGADLRRIA